MIAVATPVAATAPPDTEHVLVAVRRLLRAVRVASAEVERTARLSAAQLLVLDSAAARPGASIAELAAATMTDRSSVAAVIDRLLAAGLVERHASLVDRRRVEIAATDAGRELLRQAPHPPTRLLRDAMQSLDPAALTALGVGLDALIAAMGLPELAEECAPQES